jgi:hypothetical protein
MLRGLVGVALFASACENPAPGRIDEPVRPAPAEPVPAEPTPLAPVPAGPVEPAPPEPAKATPDPAPPPEEGDDDDDDDAPRPVAFDAGSAPVLVMPAGRGANTRLPAHNAVLGHSWGWGTATEATYRECVKNAATIGEEMWCSTEAKPRGAAKLISRLKIKRDRSVFVEPADVAGWNIAAPVGPVWLIGPDRVCAAAVGRPIVGHYSVEGGESFSDHFTFLELAWELTGCDETTADWSPIGIVTTAVDDSLRWIPGKPGPRERLDPATYNGPLASDVATLPAAANKAHDAMPGPPEWWMQTIELPGTALRELFVAAVWRGPDAPTAPDEFGCGDLEYTRVFQYRRGRTRIGHTSRGQIVGGMVGTDDAGYMVWTDSLDYSVARIEAHRLGRSVHVATGGHHPEGGSEATYSLVGYCGP